MKIAIVKLSALGDIVHALVAVQFIKQHYPHCQIDWIIEQNFAELLQHNPDIDQILTINLKAIKQQKTKLWAEIKKIRHYANNHYDLVIDAQGLLKSAITAKLLGKKTAGFDVNSIREKLAAHFYDVGVNIAYDANTIDRNVTVLSHPLGFAVNQQQILNKKPFLYFTPERLLINQYFNRQTTLILVISSTWESRNYPLKKFLAVAESLQKNCLVTWGSPSEKLNADWLAQQSKFIQVLPRLNFNALKAVIAKADLVIGNDTGPTHMAWALNIPSITLFGCTPVNRIYQTPINKAIKSTSQVNPYQLNKHDFSIQEIKVETVSQLAMTLLANATS